MTKKRSTEQPAKPGKGPRRRGGKNQAAIELSSNESGAVQGGGAASSAEPVAARAFDPLLDSFASRYIFPWEDRELGRVDSPIYLRPQLDEAGKLFERARSRWESFDLTAWGAPAGRDFGRVLRDFDGGRWEPRTIDLANRANLFLATHIAYDLSKPDELYLGDLRVLLSEQLPTAVLWASVTMRCAIDAAEECYRMSRVIEDAAIRWHKTNLTELYGADDDRWYDQIRTVLRELADDVAERREHIATCLGAGRAALALANFVEADEALEEAERLHMDLWHALNVPGITLPFDLLPRAKKFADIALDHARERERKLQYLKRATQAKIAKADEQVRTAATHLNRMRKEFPTHSIEKLHEHIRRLMGIKSQRTLDKHLAEARRRGLVPG